MTTYRAPNEYAFAAWLDALHVPYKYEALEERISRALRYQPDFWLPGPEAWLEIKPAMQPYLFPGEVRVAQQLVEATGRPVYAAAGWPYSGDKLRVWVFRAGGVEEFAEGKLALRWLMALLDVRLEAALSAARACSLRHNEFVEAWQSAKTNR